MSDRIKVFVSSTFADLRREREYTAEVLWGMGVEPQLFPEYSIAGEDGNAFLQGLKECDIMIYLATRESRWVARELRLAAEYGLPVVELAERRMSDEGASGITEHARARRSSIHRFQGDFDTLGELRKEVEAGVAAAIARRFSSASSIRTLSDDIYYVCTEYVERAQQRLGAVQRTASLVLGPHRDRLEEESRFLHAVRNRLIEADTDGAAAEILYLFDREATLTELRRNPSKYPRSAEAVEWLSEYCERLGPAGKSRVVPVKSGFTPLVLQDSTLSLATTVGRGLWFEQREAGRACAAAWDQLRNASETGLALRPVIDEARDIIETYAAADLVYLLDVNGQPAGTMSKVQAHQAPGHLHRGFSVLLLDEQNRMLLQQRSLSKYHFAGLWSNACCSHPPHDDSIERFAQQRVEHELGIQVGQLTRLGAFRYRAADPVTQLVEVEEDQVLLGQISSGTVIAPNPDEVMATRFVTLDQLQQELAANPENFTPWLGEALARLDRPG